ncbi:MAG TPA: cytochrome c3 family protein [Candidatus Krumholzibacteria bacterium]|nr:cytochrome c3 family protein [Candidatus Krumholzibacteria bacterium]
MRRLAILAAAALLAAAPAALAADAHGAPKAPATGAHAPAVTSCIQCHTCDRPTAEEPCLAPCPRHGGHFYGQHDPGEGPDVVVIDQLASLYRPVVFAHKLHAGMATMNGGCTNCHHYSEQSGQIPPCRECHAPDRQEVDLRMPALKGAYHRQCINCHLDWSGENSCSFCHEQAGEGSAPAMHDPTDIVGIPHPKIEAVPTYTYETTYKDGPVVTFHHADHVEMFGLDCVDCHRGDSCKRCHHQGEPVVPRTLDHVASCYTCHAERDCGFCHREESMPRFDHARSTGFDPNRYHKGRSCQDCHSTPDHFRTPTGKCGDCHIHWEVGSFNHAVTGLTLDETHVEVDCTSCHQGGDYNAKPTCSECHDEPMYPKRWPGTGPRTKTKG